MPVDINELIVKTSVNNEISNTSETKERIDYKDIEKIKKIILQECRRVIREEIEMDKTR